MLRIRDLVLDPPLILAPMEGVTDRVFRRLIRSVGGCSLTVTEFVAGAALAGGHRLALRAAAFDPDERPVSIQVYGRDPATLAEAARAVEGLGADLVDLNMGCPSKKVCARSGGSALMKEPGLARDIVRAIRAATTLPFTVKMRAGWDPDHRNAPDLAKMCEDEGVEMVTVHWRTRTDLYGGVRRLDTIAEVVSRLKIPVIANGDIVDEHSALTTLAETGAAGLMVGRGAMRDPWVFRRIERALAGQPPLTIDERERERVLLAYFAAVRACFDSDRGALGRMKKISKYFCEGIAVELQRAVLRAETADQAEHEVRAWFDQRERRNTAN
ncbi:MAG: tRNA-dihydrouridine synthase family protein, partial [Myxococcota bacterium]